MATKAAAAMAATEAAIPPITAAVLVPPPPLPGPLVTTSSPFAYGLHARGPSGTNYTWGVRGRLLRPPVRSEAPAMREKPLLVSTWIRSLSAKRVADSHHYHQQHEDAPDG